jgi:hypothetical protein
MALFLNQPQLATQPRDFIPLDAGDAFKMARINRRLGQRHSVLSPMPSSRETSATTERAFPENKSDCP